MQDILSLCDTVRQTAYALRSYLGPGHLEKVYETGLAHRLSKLGLPIATQHPLPVHDEDGFLLGDYYADLLVDNRLIVEIKACKSIADEHIAQILGYLRSARLEHGLLINFGAGRFQIKKFIVNDHQIHANDL